MIKTKNETRVPVTRNFRLLGFVFLVLALSFGSLAANAAPQVPERSAGKTPCRITDINLKTGVVTASVIDGGTTTLKASGGGQSFRFFVKDAALLNSLRQGEVIFANFKSEEVFTSAGANGQVARLGGILTGNFGPVDGGRPAGPVDGAKLGPVDGARPLGPIDGAKLGPVDGGRPVGPIDGAKLGNAANPGQPNCQITNINAATGVVSAKDLSTGQTFQFTVQNSALFRSFNVGQRFFANFNSRQVSLDGKAFSGIQPVGGSLPN